MFLWHISDRRRGGRGRFFQARDDVQVGLEQLGNVDGVYLRVRHIENSLYAGGPGDVGDAGGGGYYTVLGIIVWATFLLAIYPI